ncbi:MAG: hypothetical protein DWQ04_11315 [Chloroflexi bacterium]|nr:MAG: hypothetical protein DWQ04_11315 [Chloroflexota bacterium]
MQIYRFPDDTYDQFKQIVLFGIHRPKAITPDGEMVEKLAQIAVGKEVLPPLTAPSTCDLGRSSGQANPEPSYTLPPLIVKRTAFKFRSHFVDPADAITEAGRQAPVRNRPGVSISILAACTSSYGR